MVGLHALLAAGIASALLSMILTGCSGSVGRDAYLSGGTAPDAGQPEDVTSLAGAVGSGDAWPAGLPVDVQQPWEQLDENGHVIPPARSASYIDADSLFAAGVERDAASTTGVSDNGEAARLSSGDAGSGAVSWAYYRLPLSGEQPGVVSADVNLLPMSDGGRSAYYLGLSDYGNGRWQWHGPLSDNHTRLSVALGDYLSDLGDLFICVAACDGATFDLVGVAANACDAGDTEAPTAPAGLTATAVAGGIELGWNAVADANLTGYRIYHAASSFLDAYTTGVKVVPTLEGLTHYQLAATAETYARVSAVDISGNESLLSEIASATPLAGDPPDVRLTASQPSGLAGEAITLTASGADEYDWDLDGDGLFELTGLLLANADVDTGGAGLIRPMVRGLTDGGNSRACGGVSVLIGSNSRPVANGHADPSSGSAPLSVTFTGTGDDDDGTIAQYSWDFEDDGTFDYTHATEPNPPLEVYTTPGTYNAKFRVEDNLGSWDIDTVAVHVSDPLNIPPTADLAIGPGEERGNPPHIVSFDASGSTDTDGTIVEYLWDFDGDGDYDYSTATPYANDQYFVGGSYTAKVRIEDDDFGRDTATVEIGVNIAPVADLDADVTSGDPPFTVNFDASGSDDTDGTIDDYEWDLDGDGEFNEAGSEDDARGNDTASYDYDTTGVYTAEVRATDNEGLEDTATIDISVNGWMIITLDTGYEVGYDPSLAIVDGSPAIAYNDYGNTRLVYIRATTSTGANASDWPGGLILDSSGDTGWDPTLLVVDGNPAISHYNETTGTLHYTRASTATGSSSGDWSQIAVDSSVDGYRSSMAIIDGSPAIAYEHDTGTADVLKYARSTTSTGSSASDWSQKVTVDDTASVSTQVSLAAVDGNPAISYYDNVNYDLLYARSTTSTGASASDWSQKVNVESTGSSGNWSSLHVVAGNPAIAHFESAGGDLLYARSTDSTGDSAGDWTQKVTVDSSGSVGVDLSMAIIDGNPAICYLDFTDTSFNYVRSTTATGSGGGDWTPVVVEAGVSTDFEGTAMIDINGNPAIVYFDYDNEEIKYAYYVQ